MCYFFFWLWFGLVLVFGLFLFGCLVVVVVVGCVASVYGVDVFFGVLRFVWCLVVSVLDF